MTADESSDERDLLLVAYADGELDPQQVPEVEALIARDPRAARKIAMFRETAALLRAACGEGFYREAPAASVSPPPVQRRPRRLAWAVAASLLAAAAGFGGGAFWAGWRGSPLAELREEAAAYHPVYARETRHLVEVPASDAEHLSDWLGRRLARPLPIPDLADEGLAFAGGRMLVINGHPAAQLMYKREHGLPIAICLARLDEVAPLRVTQQAGQEVASWADGRYGYVVVGEMTPAFARSVATLVAQRLKT